MRNGEMKERNGRKGEGKVKIEENNERLSKGRRGRHGPK